MIPDLLVKQKTLNRLGCIARQKSSTKPLDTFLYRFPIKCKDLVCQLCGINFVIVLPVGEWRLENFIQILQFESFSWHWNFSDLTKNIKASCGIGKEEISFNFNGLFNRFNLSVNFLRFLQSWHIQVFVSLNLNKSLILRLLLSFSPRLLSGKHRVSVTSLQILNYWCDWGSW
jgi:hypothetical protein